VGVHGVGGERGREELGAEVEERLRFSPAPSFMASAEEVRGVRR